MFEFHRPRRWLAAAALMTAAAAATPVAAASADGPVRAGGVLHPSVGVSPSIVAPGGALTVSGRNWPARRAVRLYLGRPLGEDTVLDDVALVKTDSRGRFTKRLWIAPDAPPGSYSIEACRRECLVSARAQFRIEAPATPRTASAAHQSAAERAVDCDTYAHFPNTKISSARNMTCRQAVRALRRHRGPISRVFTIPGGFRCTRVSGFELAGQWRCVKGQRAFRFEFGD